MTDDEMALFTERIPSTSRTDDMTVATILVAGNKSEAPCTMKILLSHTNGRAWIVKPAWLNNRGHPEPYERRDWYPHGSAARAGNGQLFRGLKVFVDVGTGIPRELLIELLESAGATVCSSRECNVCIGGDRYVSGLCQDVQCVTSDFVKDSILRWELVDPEPYLIPGSVEDGTLIITRANPKHKQSQDIVARNGTPSALPAHVVPAPLSAAVVDEDIEGRMVGEPDEIDEGLGASPRGDIVVCGALCGEKRLRQQGEEPKSKWQRVEQRKQTVFRETPDRKSVV